MRIGSRCPSDCGVADTALLLTVVAVVAHKWQRRQQQQQLSCSNNNMESTSNTTPKLQRFVTLCVRPPLAPNGRSFSHKEQTQPVGVVVVAGAVAVLVVVVVGVTAAKESSKKSFNCCERKTVWLLLKSQTGGLHTHTHTTHTKPHKHFGRGIYKSSVSVCAKFTCVLAVLHFMLNRCS